MRKLTLEDYNVIAVSNRQGVKNKLRDFLTKELPKLKSGDIVEINSKDFLDTDDFHYYNAKKLVDAEFGKKIAVKFVLHGQGRADKLLVKVL